MKTLVITGSSRGIGFGLAKAFLARGQRVVVSGRSEQSTQNAVEELSAEADGRVTGHACEVTKVAGHEALWQHATDSFGAVDVWINNAGVTHAGSRLCDTDPEEIRATIETNLLGMIYGCQVAVRGMQAQGHGHLYNMEGLGSDGRIIPGRGPYGASKRALRYLTRTLHKETKDSAVKVSALSPGIVVTDFILRTARAQAPEDWKRARGVMNILADKPETVTPWLADKVLANDKSGATIAWLTNPKIMRRFMFAGFNKRDLFAEHGV